MRTASCIGNGAGLVATLLLRFGESSMSRVRVSWQRRHSQHVLDNGRLHARLRSRSRFCARRRIGSWSCRHAACWSLSIFEASCPLIRQTHMLICSCLVYIVQILSDRVSTQTLSFNILFCSFFDNTPNILSFCCVFVCVLKYVCVSTCVCSVQVCVCGVSKLFCFHFFSFDLLYANDDGRRAAAAWWQLQWQRLCAWLGV